MMEFVVWCIANFMATIGVIYFYSKIFDQKIGFSVKVVIAFILCFLLCSLARYFEIKLLNVLVFCVFYPIMFYMISHMKIKKLFCCTVFIWIYGAIFDFLILVIVSLVNYFFKFDMSGSLFQIIFSMLSLIFFIISAHLLFLKKFINKTVDLLCTISHSDILLAVFFLFTLIGGISIAINIDNLSLSLLIYILIALSIFIFVLIIHCKNVDFEFNIFAKTLKLNNSFYTNVDDEFSMFKHNLMAKLLSVKSVSNKKARTLIDEMVKDFNSNIDYRKLIFDLPYGLDGVINQKLCNYGDVLEIKVSNNLSFDIFDVLTPKRYNVLVEKLSLFIDNAIEACVNSVEKVLIINLMEEDNAIKIELKNTFSGEIDLNNIGKLHYSTKGDKRGFGLYTFLRNNEVSSSVKIINEYFVGEIVAKFNEK